MNVFASATAPLKRFFSWFRSAGDPPQEDFYSKPVHLDGVHHHKPRITKPKKAWIQDPLLLRPWELEKSRYDAVPPAKQLDDEDNPCFPDRLKFLQYDEDPFILSPGSPWRLYRFDAYVQERKGKRWKWDGRFQVLIPTVAKSPSDYSGKEVKNCLTSWYYQVDPDNPRRNRFLTAHSPDFDFNNVTHDEAWCIRDCMANTKWLRDGYTHLRWGYKPENKRHQWRTIHYDSYFGPLIDYE